MDKIAAIQIEKMNFSYADGTEVIRDLSLTVMEGEKVALIGPNGAGKSTLLLQMNGILRGGGKVNVFGTLLSDETVTMIRRKVGIVFQDPNDQLFCPTIFDDVSFGPLHFGIPKYEITRLVKQVLLDVGLTGFEEKSGHHISLGERKRVSIATVLACRPEILLLDEPTANLDPLHRRMMIEMIHGWRYTTIITTHDLDLAWETCERCIILDHGEIKADGPKEDILKNEVLLKESGLELPLRFQK